jgi:hypothetical protein
VPYLAAVLKAYRKLTTHSVDGKALSKAVAKDPRNALFKLLKTSKRDSRTRSRWAAALVHADASGVSPEQLSKWLKKGGGVAGRAAALANLTRISKGAANQPQYGIKSALQATPQANDPAAEATNNSNEQS